MFEVCVEKLFFETEKIVDNLNEARARTEKRKKEVWLYHSFISRKEFPTKEKALSFIKKHVRESVASVCINAELAEVKIFDDYSYLKYFRRSWTSDKPLTDAQWKHFIEGKRTVVEYIDVFTINEIHRVPCKMKDENLNLFHKEI